MFTENFSVLQNFFKILPKFPNISLSLVLRILTKFSEFLLELIRSESDKIKKKEVPTYFFLRHETCGNYDKSKKTITQNLI